jgi:hypothetical protein
LQATSEYQIYSGHGLAQQQRAGLTAANRIAPKLVATKVNVDQIALVPLVEKAPAKVKWPKVIHDPNQMETDLGVGLGYRWYGQGSLAFLIAVRRAGKLVGGEDQKRLYIRALKIEDVGMNTRNTASGALLQSRDAAIPSLADEIARNDPNTKTTAVHILGQIRTPKAARALVNLFRTGGPNDREVGVLGGRLQAFPP